MNWGSFVHDLHDMDLQSIEYKSLSDFNRLNSSEIKSMLQQICNDEIQNPKSILNYIEQEMNRDYFKNSEKNELDEIEMKNNQKKKQFSFTNFDKSHFQKWIIQNEKFGKKYVEI